MTPPAPRPPGRPRIIPPEVEEEIARNAPHVRTRRGRQNLHFRALAEKVLADDPQCAWLAEGPGGATILSELGRFRDPAAMRKAARAVCRKRPKASEAVVMLRRRRTGRKVKGPSLATRLARTVEAYLGTHPQGTWSEVRAAMDEVLEKISKTLPDGTGGEPQTAAGIRRKMARRAGMTVRDIAGPVPRQGLAAVPGVYLVALRVGGRWQPLYTGNSKDVLDRSKTLGPEGWFRRAPLRFFVVYMPPDADRQWVEVAIKAEFELD